MAITIDDALRREFLENIARYERDQEKHMDAANSVSIYRADNGWLVEVRQGNHTGKLIGRMVGDADTSPGKLIDAILVAKRLDDSNKPDKPERKLTPNPQNFVKAPNPRDIANFEKALRGEFTSI